MVNALVSVDGVELVGELQLTTLEYLELKKVCHKFYTIKRAFQGGSASPAEAHAAIVKQVCDYTLSAIVVKLAGPPDTGCRAWRGAARGPDAR